MKKHTSARIAAAIGALALGSAAIAGSVTAASAAPASYGNIDFAQSGSLTVHKYLYQGAPGTVGDISQAPAAGDFTDPVANVIFTVYPLRTAGGATLDLTAPATWDALKTIVPGSACTAPVGYSLGTGVPMPATDAAGLATLALQIGVYQVCETAAPSNIVDRALPFILTVPMPHQDGWVYNVHAYPKNGEGELVKSITPIGDATGLGTTMQFPVTMTIPEQANPWVQFRITDTFDARLTPDSSTGGNNGVASVTVNGTALDPSYFVAEYDQSKNASAIRFTPAGIAWLNAKPDHGGEQIIVTFEAKVTGVGNGTISNTVKFENGNGAEIESDPVTTNWGEFEIRKRAAGTTGTTGYLSGAVFEVYNAVDPYPASGDCTTATPDTAAGRITVTTGGTSASTFASNASGVVRIAGLFVSDSVNPAINATQRCYVLKEVQRPAGYVLPADPFTGVTVTIGAADITENPAIENIQTEVPELPLTGASGQILLISLGAAGAVIAIGLMLMNRRRTRERSSSTL